jgi:hypothetical protein
LRGALSQIAIMSTIDEKLAGLEGEHGGRSKMQELTANNPSGLKGLVKNRYATTVALSIGFGGLLYGYPSVGAVQAAHEEVRPLTLVTGSSVQYPHQRELWRQVSKDLYGQWLQRMGCCFYGVCWSRGLNYQWPTRRLAQPQMVFDAIHGHLHYRSGTLDRRSESVDDRWWALHLWYWGRYPCQRRGMFQPLAETGAMED